MTLLQPKGGYEDDRDYRAYTAVVRDIQSRVCLHNKLCTAALSIVVHS